VSADIDKARFRGLKKLKFKIKLDSSLLLDRLLGPRVVDFEEALV
jgi:hypothetical protein